MLTVSLHSNWLLEQAKMNPNNYALLSDDKKLTYNELHEKVQFVSSQLRSTIQKGDIVGINANHSPSFVINTLAVWNLAGIVFPINPNLPDEEREQQISFINCKNIAEVVTTRENQIRDEIYTVDNSALILFTSGSTNNPKAVMHTFRSLYSSAESIDSKILFESNELWLASLPFFRIGGFQMILRSLLSGGTLCIPNSVRSENLIESIKFYKPQYMSFVNATLKRFIESDIDFQDSIKAVFAGGGPIESDFLIRAYDKKLPVYKVYGSTETGSMISMFEPTDRFEKLNSAGKPLPNVKVKIHDGEVLVKSPSLFSGYYKNHYLNNDRLKDKWFNTGDIGFIDKDGFLFIEGRIDNFIISGGEKIDPREIETELLKFDLINEAVVFGVDDKKWGEKVCAVITSSEEIQIEKIIEDLKARLTAYKIPKAIKQIDQIPVDEMGKINLSGIKKLFQ